MSGGSVNGKSGCATAIVALVVISLIIAVLKAIWGLLLGLAAAAFVAAIVLYMKSRDVKPDDKQQEDEFYTQECPNCGGQIKVGISERIAHCQYCNSSFEAKFKPQEKEPEEDESVVANLTSSPIKMLLAIGSILAILGLVGFAFSGSDGTSTSDVSSSSASSSATSSSTSSPATKLISASDVKLKATTEFLEYSNKTVDPLTLVKLDSPDTVVSTNDSVDLSVVGKQKVKYTIYVGDESADQELTFTVRDTKAPTISLSNNKPSIDQWGEFNPASCIQSVADSVDGDLSFIDTAPAVEGNKEAGLEQFYETGWYTIDGSIDVNTPGTYSYIIRASDKHGNTSSRELLVTVNEVVQAVPEAEETPAAPVYTYIANANSGVFHLTGCRDVKKMKDSNKIEYTTTRQDMIDMGYRPCQHCNP